MREKTLGLWMVRLAVTIGAGAVALGLSPAVAQASHSFEARGLTSLSGSVQIVGAADSLRVTEDFDWS
ncbi:hypothetical protein AB0K00_37375 [Dactylosporangium sp. NPDC049525]|uniref:hypothetical protein n=1 Tax=Dactylosporangium sp. NPDC049525 TaxID=3154730 RepID=UPI003428988E